MSKYAFGPALLCLLLGCAGSSQIRVESSHTDKPQRVRDTVYMQAFAQGLKGAIGLSFGSVGYQVSNYQGAVETACRQLAWTQRVRIQGEQLFQDLPSGELIARGEQIQLLEVPEITPQSCRLETLVVEEAKRFWIVASLPGQKKRLGGPIYFKKQTPDWVHTTPQQKGWIVAQGIAELSYQDEAGSWEWASYRALVELALSHRSAVKQIHKDSDGYEEGLTSVRMDSRFEGVQVVARWRSEQNAHVLLAVPQSGAVSLLE
ncbi:MAG: hypothetical protein GKR89_12065 [Candidatus Latescibacteria bacterium]|nr:hypothetical protein [Candidatus Latescibacterota bacterium]